MALKVLLSRVCQLLTTTVVLLGMSPMVSEALLGIPDFLEFGSCTEFDLIKDFDPMKYSGVWFDIVTVPNEYQHTKHCVTQNYTWTGENMVVATKGLTEDGRKVRQGAVMHVEQSRQPPDPAHMTVIATGVPEAPYQITDTDYVNYACVYSCMEYVGFRAEFAWVFSRKPQLEEKYIERCRTNLQEKGVDPDKMVEVRQGDSCPYQKHIDTLLDINEKQVEENLKHVVPSTTPSPRRGTKTTYSPKVTNIPSVTDSSKYKNKLKEFETVMEEGTAVLDKLEKEDKEKEKKKKAKKTETPDDSSATAMASSLVTMVVTIAMLANF
ncbi:crustacyanin-C1 subunit-like isoform X2 [Oratosquilla oratoria]|uniref:crustacyanin-C1 subunit-like isoform X2 n=1 Tax=Oratosquilla oratoria TaxID=337810 RepID=UPI003F770F52